MLYPCPDELASNVSIKEEYFVRKSGVENNSSSLNLTNKSEASGKTEFHTSILTNQVSTQITFTFDFVNFLFLASLTILYLNFSAQRLGSLLLRYKMVYHLWSQNVQGLLFEVKPLHFRLNNQFSVEECSSSYV